MAFKTFTSVTLPASDLNTYLMAQAVISCTAATHPASPVDGMTVYETDTNKLLTWDGAAWNGQSLFAQQGSNAVPALIVKPQAAGSTTNHAAEFYDTAGTLRFAVTVGAIPKWFSNTVTATAGGAAALPATPVGYVNIDIGGVIYKVPFYAV